MLISTEERLELVKLGFLSELEDILQQEKNAGWLGNIGSIFRKAPAMGEAAAGIGAAARAAPRVAPVFGAARYGGKILDQAKSLWGTGAFKSWDEAVNAARQAMPPPSLAGQLAKGTAVGLGVPLGLAGYGAYQVGKAGLNTAQDILTGGDSGDPGRSWLETALRGGLGGAAGYYGMKWLGPQLGLPPEVMQFAPWLGGAAGAFGAQGV